MSEHTPGPWTIHREPTLNRTTVRGGFAGGTTIANLYGKGTSEATANARLIAAAPELLAELMDAVRALDLVVNAHADPAPIGDYDPVRAAVDRADLLRERFAATIAKAIGSEVSA